MNWLKKEPNWVALSSTFLIIILVFTSYFLPTWAGSGCLAFLAIIWIWVARDLRIRKDSMEKDYNDYIREHTGEYRDKDAISQETTTSV